MTLETLMVFLALTPPVAVAESLRRLRLPPFDLSQHRDAAYWSLVGLLFVVVAGAVLEVGVLKVCGNIDFRHCAASPVVQSLVGEKATWVILIREMTPVILLLFGSGFLVSLAASGVPPGPARFSESVHRTGRTKRRQQ